MLGNLLELYAHDFSEYVPLALKPNGRFDIDLGDRWWTAEHHHPFFIRQGGTLCGFALVRRGSRLTAATDVMDVAEFFVVRGARRTGIGRTVAHALFGMFPGAWEIRVRPANVHALRFWSRAVETWLGRPVAIESVPRDGVEWNVLRVAHGRP